MGAAPTRKRLGDARGLSMLRLFQIGAAVVPGAYCAAAGLRDLALAAQPFGGRFLQPPFANKHGHQSHPHQPPQRQHHRRQKPGAESLDVLRDGLPGKRLQEADGGRRQRAQHHHALQLGPAKAGRCSHRRHRGSRWQCAGLRHPDHLRRHGDGHRRHEVQPGQPRSDFRLRGNLRARPVDGRRAGGRRLRQEHAGRPDGHAACQCARHLCVRRHHPAGALSGQGSEHRQRVRGGG